jgi:hypothetical protein
LTLSHKLSLVDCFGKLFLERLTKRNLKIKGPLLGLILTDFSASLEMTDRVLLEALNYELMKDCKLLLCDVKSVPECLLEGG